MKVKFIKNCSGASVGYPGKIFRKSDIADLSDKSIKLLKPFKVIENFSKKDNTGDKATNEEPENKEGEKGKSKKFFK